MGVTELTEADRQAVADYLTNLAAVMRGESHACLVCGAPVEAYHEVFRCVHAEPCGHRQWQGKLPR